MKRKVLALTIFILFALFGAPFVRAQENAPQIIISWKANGSYAPPFFQGKILPTKNSSVSARLLVLENGQIANLAQTEVRWFLNNRLIGSSLGLTEIELFFSQLSGRSNSLSVTLRQYRGQDFNKSITLPIHPPKILIDESDLISIENKSAVRLRAYPFFFSVLDPTEILFKWRINRESREGIGRSGSDFFVNLSPLESGAPLNLEVQAENMENFFEKAVSRKIFIID